MPLLLAGDVKVTMPSLRLLVLLAAVIGVAPGCGSSGAPPKVYVLGDTIAEDPVMVSQLDAPSVEVRTARVPDYLDTTEIVTRAAGGLIVPSQSGRWGERFLIGLTRAVTTVLSKRLPNLAVTASGRWGEPRWQVGIELDALDVQPSRSSTLAATWRIVDVQHRRKLAEERIVLTANGTFNTDGQVVAVMGHQVDEMAERIAVSLAPIAGVLANASGPTLSGVQGKTAAAIMTSN